MGPWLEVYSPFRNHSTDKTGRRASVRRPSDGRPTAVGPPSDCRPPKIFPLKANPPNFFSPTNFALESAVMCDQDRLLKTTTAAKYILFHEKYFIPPFLFSKKILYSAAKNVLYREKCFFRRERYLIPRTIFYAAANICYTAKNILYRRDKYFIPLTYTFIPIQKWSEK